MFNADCLDKLKDLKENSIHSLITDPPAGISFMGKDWDGDKGDRDTWILWLRTIMKECFRVMKPGAHGLVWAIPRTSHWTATALEDAGFEIRDVVTHLFGSGFPKSLNISKQIGKQYECQYIETAKLAENQYERFPVKLEEGKTDFVAVNVVIRHAGDPAKPTAIGVEVDLSAQTDTLLFESTALIDLNTISFLRKKLVENLGQKNNVITLTKLEMITDLKIWNLLQFPNTLKNTISLNGTSLKPASEHWILVRKPCSEKTVAKNVLKWGVGGINIDECRVGTETRTYQGGSKLMEDRPWTEKQADGDRIRPQFTATGRFPANLVLDEVAAEMLDEQVGKLAGGGPSSGRGFQDKYVGGKVNNELPIQKIDKGGFPSRFFYVAKASKKDRNEGLEGMPKGLGKRNFHSGMEYKQQANGTKTSIEQIPEQNTHPTVKSTKLMEYLITLITPPNGIILDPFMGSGSTGVAAKRLGFKFIGIEKEKEYFNIAEKRCEALAT